MKHSSFLVAVVERQVALRTSAKGPAIVITPTALATYGIAENIPFFTMSYRNFIVKRIIFVLQSIPVHSQMQRLV